MEPTDRGIDDVLADMDALLARLAPTDPRAAFLTVYRRTTVAVGKAVAAGEFLDGAWVERWDVVFADLYLQALAADVAAQPVPGPWSVAFRYGRQRATEPLLRHVLLGMNAHINYDLPQALVAVISADEFQDAGVVARRAEDNERVDAILVSRVSAEDAELAARGRSLTDRLLQPANRAATRRFLSESRRKCWANARVLSAARTHSDSAFEQTLAELERASTAKVEELVRPGLVLLRLAARGFGVALPGATGVG